MQSSARATPTSALSSAPQVRARQMNAGWGASAYLEVIWQIIVLWVKELLHCCLLWSRAVPVLRQVQLAWQLWLIFCKASKVMYMLQYQLLPRAMTF